MRTYGQYIERGVKDQTITSLHAEAICGQHGTSLLDVMEERDRHATLCHERALDLPRPIRLGAGRNSLQGLLSWLGY